MKPAITILALVACSLAALACSKTDSKKAQPHDAGQVAPQPVKNPWAGLTPTQIGQHKGSVLHVAFSPSGDRLLSTGHDKLIRLWDLTSPEPVRTLAGHQDKVMMAAFSPDGKLLVSASADKTARIWNLATGKLLKKLLDRPPRKMTEEQELAYAARPPAQMNWAAFTPDGKQVITASNDFALKLWEVSSGKKLTVFQDEGCRQRSVYRRRDAPGWVSSAGCMDDGVSYMKFWNEDGSLASVHGDEQRDAHFLAFDRAKRFAIAADGSLSFSVFSAQGSYLKRVMVGTYHFCMAFGPDDKTLLVGTAGGEIMVYRPGSWKREGKVDVGERVAIESMDVSPADGSLAIGLRNGKVLHLPTPIR